MADPTRQTDFKVEGEFVGATDETQASHITDLATDANGTAIATAVNAILAALEDVGILADA